MRSKIYYGGAYKENRCIYATVTGEMSDGTKVYTEIATKPDGSIIKENGEPKLLLDNQYIRTLRHGAQYFFKL